MPGKPVMFVALDSAAVMGGKILTTQLQPKAQIAQKIAKITNP
jgi:hypothetical protein